MLSGDFIEHCLFFCIHLSGIFYIYMKYLCLDHELAFFVLVP